MLNLRGVYLKPYITEDSSEGQTMTEPRFVATLVGNLGAPLNIGFTPSTISTARESDTGYDNDEASEKEIEVSVDPLSAGLDAKRKDVKGKAVDTSPPC